MAEGKRILVGLDGSSWAEAALPYVEKIATAGNTTVVLMRVVPPAGKSTAEPPQNSTHDEADDRSGVEVDADLRRHDSKAEHYLADIAERLGQRGVTVETAIVSGEPAPVLIEQAQLRGAELIILSTHGRSGLGRWIYGSVADQVMRESTVPVVLIPSTSHFRWPEGRAPRILIPLDGSPLAEAVLAPALALAETLRAELILVRVVGLPMGTYAWSYPDGASYLIESLDLQEAEARQYLDAVAARLRETGRGVTAVTQIGMPAFTIIDVAREQQADLIALSTHGASGLTRLVMGSVATTLARHAHQPILVVRPQDTSTAESAATATGHSGAPPAG